MTGEETIARATHEIKRLIERQAVVLLVEMVDCKQAVSELQAAVASAFDQAVGAALPIAMSLAADLHHIGSLASLKREISKSDPTLAEVRDGLLQIFQESRRRAGSAVTIGDICRLARVPQRGHRSFASWRRGDLPDSSPAAVRIEKVLRYR